MITIFKIDTIFSNIFNETSSSIVLSHMLIYSQINHLVRKFSNYYKIFYNNYSTSTNNTNIDLTEQLKIQLESGLEE